MEANNRRIDIIDPLRGLAALAVCIRHFAPAETLSWAQGAIWEIERHSGNGIHVFFVVSGFVIPYSMARFNYRLRDAPRFMARRLARLEPPYLASVALVIGLHWLSMHSPGFRGSSEWPYSWPQIAAHFGYINALIGYPWVNGVYWTLGIEFQYYLFMAAVFPLLFHRIRLVRCLTPLGIAALGIVSKHLSLMDAVPRAPEGQDPLLFDWLPIFAIGMVTCQFVLQAVGRACFAAQFALIAATAAFTVGGLPALTAVATSAAILAGVEGKIPKLKFLTWIGTISYSLYLLHMPIGSRLSNLYDRLGLGPEFYPLKMTVQIVVSVAAAWIFWWLVERPSMRWAKRLPYRNPAVT